MSYERGFLNAVLLPDASVLVVGGVNGTGISGQPVLQMERFRGGTWEPLANLTSPRDYHSVAILLPSGKVLIAAGEGRIWDYEIYVPPYLEGSPSRPVWGAVSPPLEPISYGTVVTAFYSMTGPGAAVDKVVLMRPASLTHHSCSDQRYVQLEITEHGDNFVRFRMPPGAPGTQPAGSNANAAAKGYWMMFLVSQAGVPSVAKWVLL